MIGSPMECISYLTRCDHEKHYEVKEKRKGRTKTQNAYYWEMLNKLAAVLGMPDSEVHLNMLRDWGVCHMATISAETPPEDCFKYFDVQRRVGDSIEVKVYKGSSQMDTKEFTRLIDGMREECVAQGIDVMTPEEIASLKFEGA